MLSKIFTLSPYPELIARKFYYKIIKNSVKIRVHKDEKHRNRKIIPKTEIDLDKLFLHLKNIGIKNNDLLIVHSSINALNHLQIREDELLDRFLELLGSKGTLALPAFPKDSMLKKKDGISIYDPQHSLAWTGMLPNLLMRKKESVRSKFPCNPLIAYGSQAEAMMENNLKTEFAHGKNSCWGFCAEHHAKILFLGIPTYHSDTILHVVEDYQPNFWPSDWYINREYLVKIGDNLKHIKVKLRDTKWSMYLAEQYTEQKYFKAGFIQRADFMDCIQINLINDSFELINSIMTDWNKFKFYYIPAKKLHSENQRKGVF